MSLALSPNAFHSTASAQQWIATAESDAVRWVQEGRARVWTAPPSTKTVIDDRRAKVAAGDVRRLRSDSAEKIRRRSSSG